MRKQCELAQSKLSKKLTCLLLFLEKPSRRKVLRGEIGFRTWIGREGLQGFSGISERGRKGSDTGRRHRDPVLEKQCHLVWLEQRVDDRMQRDECKNVRLSPKFWSS